MTAHTMYRYTLVAPLLRNDGEPSGYDDAVRDALLAASIDGWTEYSTVGSWRGKREHGVLFEFYRAFDRAALVSGHFEQRLNFAALLGAIGRECMPDQEAVQVTLDPNPVTLWEA